MSYMVIIEQTRAGPIAFSSKNGLMNISLTGNGTTGILYCENRLATWNVTQAYMISQYFKIIFQIKI